MPNTSAMCAMRVSWASGRRVHIYNQCIPPRQWRALVSMCRSHCEHPRPPRRLHHTPSSHSTLPNPRFYATSSPYKLRFRSRRPPLSYLESTSDKIQALHSNDAKLDIAVLGAGITGLAFAYFITRLLPQGCRVTIYEASDRAGGWVRSKRVPLSVGKGSVLFETGPRSLRTNVRGSGTGTLQLVHEMDLEKDTIAIPRTAPAAKNRYLYYPDHLVKMPGPGMSWLDMAALVWREPLFNGLPRAFLREWSIRPLSDHVKDMSVGAFLTRRFGSDSIVNNIVSAVLHGIYAGDPWKLSARSLLRNAWASERAFGSLTMAALEALGGNKVITRRQHDMDVLLRFLRPTVSRSLPSSLRSASVYTFRDGVEQLTTALREKLESNPNVTIKLSHRIETLAMKPSGAIAVGLANPSAVESSTKPPATEHTHCIATIPSPNFARICQQGRSLGFPIPFLTSLASQKGPSVMVVSLFYADPNLLPVEGFGYLIPSSVPFEQNPEFALGVVFDSSFAAAQSLDASAPPNTLVEQDTVPGTKLTVMLGGHWWDFFSPDTLPSEAEGVKMARSVLKRHLGITAEPLTALATLHHNSIPQYEVGHTANMQEAHKELLSEFKGKVRVAGSAYHGVGVNDCVQSAYLTAMNLAIETTKPDEGEWKGILTGLEMFADGDEVYLGRPTAGTYLRR